MIFLKSFIISPLFPSILWQQTPSKSPQWYALNLIENRSSNKSVSAIIIDSGFHVFLFVWLKQFFILCQRLSSHFHISFSVLRDIFGPWKASNKVTLVYFFILSLLLNPFLGKAALRTFNPAFFSRVSILIFFLPWQQYHRSQKPPYFCLHFHVQG